MAHPRLRTAAESAMLKSADYTRCMQLHLFVTVSLSLSVLVPRPAPSMKRIRKDRGSSIPCSLDPGHFRFCRVSCISARSCHGAGEPKRFRRHALAAINMITEWETDTTREPGSLAG